MMGSLFRGRWRKEPCEEKHPSPRIHSINGDTFETQSFQDVLLKISAYALKLTSPADQSRIEKFVPKSPDRTTFSYTRHGKTNSSGKNSEVSLKFTSRTYFNQQMNVVPHVCKLINSNSAISCGLKHESMNFCFVMAVKEGPKSFGSRSSKNNV